MNLLRTIGCLAQTVYNITEGLVDLLPDENRNPFADDLVNYVYEDLLRADKLIDMSENLLALHIYPSYVPEHEYWKNWKPVPTNKEIGWITI